MVHYSRTGRAPYHRLPDDPHSPEFAEAYALLRKGEAIAKAGIPPPTTASPQTFRWLFVKYQKSADFKARDKAILETCCQEPIKKGDPRRYEDMPLGHLTTANLRVLVDRKRKANLPEAANSRIKSIKRMCKYGVAAGHLSANPAADLERVKNKSSGHKPWTSEDIDAFERRHPIGTKARLALAILMHLGCARVDCVGLGNGSVHTVKDTKDGNVHTVKGIKVVRYCRGKTEVEANVPLPQALLDIIASTPMVGVKTWLVTEYGKPFSAAGFGNKFGEWCRQANLMDSKKRAHGLRKTAATRAAERGASAHTLCAAFGWLTLKEAERYCQSASRRKLGAMLAELG
jgi:integrase